MDSAIVSVRLCNVCHVLCNVRMLHGLADWHTSMCRLVWSTCGSLAEAAVQSGGSCVLLSPVE